MPYTVTDDLPQTPAPVTPEPAAVTPEPTGVVSPMQGMIDRMLDYGWSPEAAAGIVGNLWHETAETGSPSIWGAGSDFGWAQWTGPRRQALAKFATDMGKPADDPGVQAAFINYELATDYTDVAERLRGAKTAAEAARIFSSGYERPGRPMLNRRISLAEKAFGLIGPRAAEAAEPPLTGGKFVVTDAPPAGIGKYVVTDIPSEEVGADVVGKTLTEAVTGPVDFGEALAAIPDVLGTVFGPGKPKSVMMTDKQYGELAKMYPAGREEKISQFPFNQPLSQAKLGVPYSDLSSREQITEGLSEFGRNLGLGWRSAAGGLYNKLANIPGLMNKLADLSGVEEYRTLGTPEKWLRGISKEVTPKLEEMPRDLFGVTVTGLGGAPIQVAEYAAGIKWLGPIAGMGLVDAIGAADKGVMPTIEAAVKGATAGTFFKGIEPFTLFQKINAMGVFGGLQAAMEGGGPRDIAANTITMAMLGLTAGGGDVKAQDLVRNAWEGFKSKYDTFPGEIKEGVEGVLTGEGTKLSPRPLSPIWYDRLPELYRTWKSRVDEGPVDWEAGKNDITRSDTGYVDPRKIADIKGERGEEKLFDERPSGRLEPDAWEQLKEKIRTEGIKEPITIFKEKNGDVRIHEGNHRLRAALELGADAVPVDVRYFGNSQRDGLIKGLEPSKAEPRFMGKEIERGPEEKAERVEAPDLTAEREGRLGGLSAIEAETQRLLDDFRSRRNQEIADLKQKVEAQGLAGEIQVPDIHPLWSEVEFSPEFSRDPEFQRIADFAKTAGIDHVIPTRNAPFRGAFHPEEGVGKWLFLDENPGDAGYINVAEHELFHGAAGEGNFGAQSLMDQVDTQSRAFRQYKNYYNKLLKDVGLDPLDNKGIAEELAADFVADMSPRAGAFGLPINLRRAFRSPMRAELLRDSYRVGRGVPEAGGAAEARASEIGWKEKLSPRDRASELEEQARDREERGTPPPVGMLRQFFTNIWRDYVAVPEWRAGSYKDIINKYLGSRQVAGWEMARMIRGINRSVPGKINQIGITNWIQAGGDRDLLRQRMDATTDPYLKAGYEAALALGPGEIENARMAEQYYRDMWNEGNAAGVIEDFIERYVNQIWKRENRFSRSLRATASTGMLNTRFDNAKRRIFESYFEGEQAGFNPKDKTIGYLLGQYHQSMYEAIAARKAVKDLFEGTGKDGRPLVYLEGAATPIPREETKPFAEVPPEYEMTAGPKAYLVFPKAVPKDFWEYRVIDHPALRKWKWVTNDAQGKPILEYSSARVHPEIYDHLKNVLVRSEMRKKPWRRALMTGVQSLKSTLLGLSGFHQVQIGVHALFHKVNPFNAPELNLGDSTQRSLVEHGLMVYNHNALAEFAEGLHDIGIIPKIPGIGPLMTKYSQYLFQDFIPRVKMKMALEAYERNLGRYRDKYTNDQILELTAQQANAAFGELNYKAMGRNPTTQDVFRLVALAPDFLEARLKFVGQAFAPGGREQATALIRGALGMYLMGVIGNMLLSDGNKAHWDRPFTLVLGDKSYNLRSVPGDMAHLFKDWRSFVYHRLSPTTVRTMIELVTGRDVWGRRRDLPMQVRDFFVSHFPIPTQSLFSEREETILDAALRSLGVSTYKYRSNADIVMMDYFREYRVDRPSTSEARELTRLHRNIVNLTREGKEDEAVDKIAVAAKKLDVAPKKILQWIEEAAEDPQIVNFRKLPVDWQLKVMEAATPEEEAKLAPIFVDKLFKAAPEKLEKIAPQLEQYLGRP